MIRKLIISAAVLAALIHGKEASAAGPGGFARDLAFSVTAHAAMVQSQPDESDIDGITSARDHDVSGISAAASEAIGGFDSYLDLFRAQ
ncbi:hypothetical protein [Neorhizobium sp. NCHU2750]|uniref:hypothetical protein n=1 Tax=Neorhizobium sp. NCHU2750 TaxID=1825976 RepID=UPI000E7149C2|nr:hypothetical protein NCHU2750_26200 [Neorhizobium sp. NCHU2750]